MEMWCGLFLLDNNNGNKVLEGNRGPPLAVTGQCRCGQSQKDRINSKNS